jgi:hypothetical protein
MGPCHPRWRRAEMAFVKHAHIAPLHMFTVIRSRSSKIRFWRRSSKGALLIGELSVHEDLSVVVGEDVVAAVL